MIGLVVAKRPKPRHLLLFLFAVTALSACAAYAAPIYELVRKIENPNGPVAGSGDEFGISIAGVGENVLIGAYREDTGGENAGSAYLFDPNGNLLTTYRNPTPQSDDWFGYKIETVEDKIIIAARRDNNGAPRAGAVYIYEQDGTLLKTITNPSPEEADIFGNSVLRLSNKILISARSDNTQGEDSGAAYLFDQQGTLLHRFFSPKPDSGDKFGRVTAALGSSKFAISSFEDVNGIDGAGVIYLFDLIGNELLRIPNPDPETEDLFGGALASIGDDMILIGAPRANDSGAAAGAAYLYRSDGRRLETILNPTPETRDLFGRTMVGITDEIFLIGDPFDNTLENSAGAAYLYNVDGKLLQTILPPEPVQLGHFSSDMGVVGNRLYIGSHFDGGGFTGPGAVYEYRLVPEPSTWAMLSIGITLLLLLGRRKQRSK